MAGADRVTTRSRCRAARAVPGMGLHWEVDMTSFIARIAPMLALVAAGWLAYGPAGANLVSLGNGLVYDSDLDITWQADANLSATNTFGVSGFHTIGSHQGLASWDTAQSWIAAMNAAKYKGFDDWRLPRFSNPDGSFCVGYSCTGSEFGHLFYDELGGQAGHSINTTHNAQYGLFSNIDDWWYWTDFRYQDSPNPPYYRGGTFDMAFGDQAATLFTDNAVALWAVRNGGVPEPATLWLVALGLAAAVVGRRAVRPQA